MTADPGQTQTSQLVILVQVAFVVSDIEAAAARFARLLGVEVPEIRESPDLETSRIRYRGEPTHGRRGSPSFDWARRPSN